MDSRWLFRCNVATERETNDTKKTRGLGHAMRCIALSRVVEQNGGTVHFSVEGAQDVEEFLSNEGISCSVTSEHQSVLQTYEPDVLVIDINYLSPRNVESLREYAPVVNLAPRGETKYYADLTFTNSPIEDVSKPHDASLQEWHHGPKYSILSPNFTSVRKKINNEGWSSKKQGIVIQMGGVDQFNMTGAVLDNIDFERFTETSFTIIAGPFNPHTEDLKKRSDRHDNVRFRHDPDGYAKLVANHQLGFFGTGISTFEGMAVGVPSLNLGHSMFHDQRGNYIENENLGYYLGRYDTINPEVLNNKLESLMFDGEELENLKNRCIATVDGKACERIYLIIHRYLKQNC